MYKVLWMLKRRPDVTFEHFRDHYENSHSALGKKYLGHLMVGYRRNYDLAYAAGSTAGLPRMSPSGYDCVAEWDMRDEAAFHEAMRLLSDPEIGKIFHDDEEHFLDRTATKLVVCDCHDTGTALD